MDKKTIFLFTGLSGAGKSTALQVMQDMGFFTADGISPKLIYDFYQTLQKPEMQHFKGLAIGFDVWRGASPNEIQEAITALRSYNIPSSLIFLEAEEDVLLRRYATTRRPHPFEIKGLGLISAIKQEREANQEIRSYADLIIDSSTLNIHDLRRVLQKSFYLENENQFSLQINLLSFGYKYAIPKEADLVFDLRFLPNPYFIPELKELSGLDQEVANYVLSHKISQDFLVKFLDFLYFLLPLYQAEGRYKVCLALGCTGGQHRSVTIAEYIYKELKQHGYNIQKTHLSCNQANNLSKLESQANKPTII